MSEINLPDVITFVQMLPKSTICYLVVSALYHLEINNVFLAIIILLDILDYLPM